MARGKVARSERNTRDHKRGKRIQPKNAEQILVEQLWNDDGSYPSTYMEKMLGGTALQRWYYLN